MHHLWYRTLVYVTLHPHYTIPVGCTLCCTHLCTPLNPPYSTLYNLHYCTLHQPSIRVHMLSPPSVLYFRLHPHCVPSPWSIIVPPTLCILHSILHPPGVYIHSTYVKPTLCIVHSMLHQPFVLYSLCCTHLVHCTLYICCTHLVYLLYTQCCTNLLYCTLYVAPTLCTNSSILAWSM